MRRCAMLLVALLAGACTRSTVQVNLKEGPALPAQAAAVYPFTFRWPEKPHRAFELSEVLVLKALEGQRYAVFGPGEFRLIRATSDNPFVGSDLALGLSDRGLSPLEALVFRPSAERRSQSAQAEVYDEKGKAKGGAAVEEVTLVARLEVFHSSTRELIADLTGTAEVDPFGPRDASDPLPELTALMKKLMEAALTALEQRAPGRPVSRDPGFEFIWNPRAAWDYSLEGRPSLTEELKAADALEQDLQLDARLRFFLPDLDERTADRLKRLPGGLYVTKVTGAGKQGLQVGDLIMEINGEPALPQSLYRALRSKPVGHTVPARVRRSTGITEVALPVLEPAPK